MGLAMFNPNDKERIWNFEQAHQWLSGFQFHGIRPGLERISKLLQRLGHPEKSFKSIHIAGTNGKGSTASILARILYEHGLKVGLYTSPHLVSVTERFVINGKSMSKQVFARIAKKVKENLKDLPATYFELTTGMAFLYFAESQVDIAIVECGLGGLLDATNVIIPEVSIITNVGLDHQAYLGHTFKEIAFEKAGIIKPGVPVVVGPMKKEALGVIFQVAQKNNADLFLYNRDFRIFTHKGYYYYSGRYRFSKLELSLKGTFQKINLALALKALEIIGEKDLLLLEEVCLRNALRQVSWPGRFEFINTDRLIILDGAHNLEGIKALLNSLESQGIKNYDLIFAVSNEGGTKPYLKMLKTLLGKAEMVTICEPPGPREPVTIKEWMKHLNSLKCRRHIFLERSLEKALERAFRIGRYPLLITGSLYLIGAVRPILLRNKQA